MNHKLQIKIGKFFLKTVLAFCVLIVFNFYLVHNVSASTLTLSTEKNIMHQQEQFLVDIFLAPDKNENVNAFDVSISYSPNLTFVGSNDGPSIVNLWIEKPNLKEGSINFSGIIPGGFSGLVNPMNLDSINNQKPGLLTELIFVGNSEGPSFVDFNKQIILANDGSGTVLETKSNNLSINIDDKVVSSMIDISDITPPEPFSIILSQDSMLFDGKYTIIFDTKDKGTGINYYEVKEEGFDWQKAESPYVTAHQPPVGTIFVKAFDYKGNSTVEEITPNIPLKQVPFESKLFAIVFILVIIILIGILVRYLKRKVFHVI